MFASNAVQARFLGQVPLATTMPQPLLRPSNVDSFELVDSNVAGQFASTATVRSSSFAGAMTLAFLGEGPVGSSSGPVNPIVGYVLLAATFLGLAGLKVYLTRRGYHWTRAAFTDEGRFLNEGLRPDAKFVNVKAKMSWKERAALADALSLVFNRRGDLRIFTEDFLASALLGSSIKMDEKAVVFRNGHKIELGKEEWNSELITSATFSREYKGGTYKVKYTFGSDGEQTYYSVSIDRKGVSRWFDSNGMSSFHD